MAHVNTSHLDDAKAALGLQMKEMAETEGHPENASDAMAVLELAMKIDEIRKAIFLVKLGLDIIPYVVEGDDPGKPDTIESLFLDWQVRQEVSAYSLELTADGWFIVEMDDNRFLVGRDVSEAKEWFIQNT